MTPTPKLRFVERFVPAPEHGDGIGKRVRILQQWWEQKGMTMNMGWGGEMPIGEIKGEWRDVPLEEEQ
jgi:hypothetical protein